MTSHPNSKRIFILTMTAACGTLGSFAARAGCADAGAAVSAQHMIPVPAPADASAFHGLAVEKRIVGTWLVSYFVGGNPTGQAYIQWHADGTEWEFIDRAIAGGTICLGSWKKVDVDHVSRYHHGWTYADGLLTGHFDETETTAVGHDGTYTGVTEIKRYDLDGNLLADVFGTSSAVLLPR